jgi:hypothetical protein
MPPRQPGCRPARAAEDTVVGSVVVVRAPPAEARMDAARDHRVRKRGRFGRQVRTAQVDSRSLVSVPTSPGHDGAPRSGRTTSALLSGVACDLWRRQGKFGAGRANSGERAQRRDAGRRRGAGREADGGREAEDEEDASEHSAPQGVATWLAGHGTLWSRAGVADRRRRLDRTRSKLASLRTNRRLPLQPAVSPLGARRSACGS